MKNIIYVGASPKKSGGAPKLFLWILKLFLFDFKNEILSLRRKSDYEPIFEKMRRADALVLSVPIYVDGSPSHVLSFLLEAEKLIKEENLNLNFYVISNMGFVEGRQNKVHFEIYRCFCVRAGINFAGAVSIGGGIMVYIICLLILIHTGIFILSFFFQDIFGQISLEDFLINQLINVFLIIGMLYGIIRLAIAIRKKTSIKNIYTRPSIFSFIFLIPATIFMIIGGISGGNLPWQLFKKEENLPENFIYRKNA